MGQVHVGGSTCRRGRAALHRPCRLDARGDRGRDLPRGVPGLESNPVKVRIVALKNPLLDEVDSTQGVRAGGSSTPADRSFSADVNDAAAWRRTAGTSDEIVESAVQAVWVAVADLARLGKRAGGRGRRFVGESLRWANLDFRERAREMRIATVAALDGSVVALPSSSGLSDPDNQRAIVVRRVADQDVAFVVSAVPGAFSQPEARAVVGRPFASEPAYLTAILGAGAVGPVHVIPVYQGVTETQVRTFIGRPDALIAAQSFCIVTSDDASFCQALFLPNARHTSAISSALGDALEWWHRAGFEVSVARRARARTAVLKALREINTAL